MIRNSFLSHLPLFVALLTPATLSAQGTFDLDEIKVVAPYEPTISDAHKIALSPSIDQLPEIQLTFNYVIPPRKLRTSFELDPITPARMRGEPLAKLYRGLVKGGYGNYSTPYFEGFYNSLRSNSHELGVHMKHLSSGGGIDSTGHSGYSQNTINLAGARFFDKHALSGAMQYDRDILHYYGFNRDHFIDNQELVTYIDSLQKKDIRQGFNQLGANLAFATHRPDSSRLNHRSGLSYRYLADQYDAREHHATYTGYIGRNISADPFGMADDQHFSMNLDAAYFDNQHPLDTNTTFLFGLQPRIWSRFNNFSFYIGLQANVQIDTVSYFRAYPMLGIELRLADNNLIAFASLSGETQKHTLYTLSRENPFLNTTVPLQFMNIKSDISIGVKGKLGGMLSYKLALNRTAIDNYAFFVNDTSTLLNNIFSVAYDDISRFGIYGELMSQFGERFSAKITANYFQYGLTNEIEAWHTPTTLLSAHLRYNLQNKIILSSDVYARGETYGRIVAPDGTIGSKIAHKVHPDINLGIEYRYTKLLSVFLHFNNVNNASIERWLNYPTQGFNFLGGITYSF